MSAESGGGELSPHLSAMRQCDSVLCFYVGLWRHRGKINMHPPGAPTTLPQENMMLNKKKLSKSRVSQSNTQNVQNIIEKAIIISRTRKIIS